MKILMIEPLGDGGITHYTYNLLSALSREGIDATLLTNTSYEFSGQKVGFKVYNRMFRLANLMIRRFSVLNKESGLPALVRRILKILEYPLNTVEAAGIAIYNNIEVIHLQSVNLTEFLMVIAFSLIRKKIVFTIHNVNPRHKKMRLLHRIIYSMMYRLCDRIIIHSEKGKTDVAELFSIDHDKIHVIPHGDYKFFVPENPVTINEAKEALAIQFHTKTILFFGAVRENKGLDNILRVMPMIRERIPNVKLLIVGEPWEDYSKYRNLITMNRLEECIWEKLDYIPNEEVPRYFQASDVVVLPYREITGSGILQIAYAFAKPVVASDLDGFRETIDEGKNGYLVALGDDGELAVKICEILQDDVMRDQMGRHSRYLADIRYNWYDISLMTLKVYGHLE